MLILTIRDSVDIISPRCLSQPDDRFHTPTCLLSLIYFNWLDYYQTASLLLLKYVLSSDVHFSFCLTKIKPLKNGDKH